jgi:hypothetical protein
VLVTLSFVALILSALLFIVSVFGWRYPAEPPTWVNGQVDSFIWVERGQIGYSVVRWQVNSFEGVGYRVRPDIAVTIWPFILIAAVLPGLWAGQYVWRWWSRRSSQRRRFAVEINRR